MTNPIAMQVPPRAGDPEITPEVVADHGLTAEEYQKVLRIMGREPTFTELGVFSAMWSEHCGYKNSKRLLRLLPTQAPWVIQGPGENAGVIDVGDGYALAFKIESHNHPSAVEPYQGAATGVGGILRDIFTMGARPVAVLDSLRFGDLDSGRVRYLFDGVVKGVGDYGNCVGIPNVGGEIQFDRGYEGNPIVNAMCLGLMKHDELITAAATGNGAPLMAVGARTGRDGIHGATFASEELSEDSDESSRPQVQVGDPFTEKLLLEASLELIASGAISAIQDMGAAGITSSASEMAGRGGSGIELEMTDVPVREDGMTPYEILLSESQERMLVVAHVGREDEVREILEKWELEAAVIGQVTDDGKFRILENGNVVGDIPALPLTDGCPTYEREGIESDEIVALREMDLSEHLIPEGDLTKSFLLLLSSPNVASKRWIYQQYDTTVRTGTAVRPGGDSGVIRIRGTNRAVAATTDCNGRFVYLEPRTGAMAAVAEAARNLVCVGAVPTAITNNLNFGNPLKAHIYYQLREAVLGMREACGAFETPVTGGNVSLFNETDGKAIYPTPVIGMVGVIDDVSKITRHAFQHAGDDIILLGTNSGEFGGSEYLYVTSSIVAGHPPSVDLEAERLLQQAVLKMNHEEVLNSAHDCSEGGLAATLVECALGDGETPLGVTVDLDEDLAPVVSLFGESQGRIIASTNPDDTERVLALAALYDVPATKIGTVTEISSGFSVNVRSGSIQASMADLAKAYFGAIPGIMDVTTGSEA
ncbi:phosphoribosylformylglycinamidine synthase subunit PurL [Gemmatimonadales bacterium]|nr:phosphoribosylformylglycinamidine synthase subunit PurL [Gemmatimonadales bacterium]